MSVTYELLDDVGVIVIENPPVNALSQAVRKGLIDAVDEAQTDSSKAIVIVCEGRTFVAGADINEFNSTPKEPTLPEVMSAIEESCKPVIAALHGTALGGGLELALSCHYRCAVESAVVGLPEVKLGLVPGAGGTQRLPRLIGVEAALDMMTSGKKINANEAAGLGLIDELVNEPLRAATLDFALKTIAEGKGPRRTRDIVISEDSFTKPQFEAYRSKLQRRLRGQNAPQDVVTCVEAAMYLPFEEGLKKERQIFLQCRESEQSAALRHIFFAERQAAKVKGLDQQKKQTREVEKVGVIGGGTMGAGIAMSFANAGIAVTLLEVSHDALDRGLKLIEKNYDNTVRKGKLAQFDADTRRALITGTIQYEDFAECDLVIEAVFEDINVKKQVFTELDRVCKPGAILASNTSYLNLDEIASSVSRPQDVIGLHFFSPANVMKLLEVVQGERSSPEVIATGMQIGKKIGKIPVLARVCYGFIGNRMLRQYAREAQLCLIEGSSPEDVDKALTDFGMAMGPLAVGDLAGIDIGYKARKALSEREKGDPKTYCIADALAEMGRLGQKTGAGYYRYDEKARVRVPDPEVIEIIEEQSKLHGVVRRSISDEEIVHRHIFALINEGFKILEEGIAQRSSDIDVVYVFGYGFPSWRGGPMFYAQMQGLDNVYRKILEYYEASGEDHWRPAKLLEYLANEQLSLSDWESAH